jgi:metal-responsive CopG/Arc/MetJ family transcriptional regulator
MAAISLRLPDDLEARLDREAAAEGMPRSEVARTAIEEFLDRRERQRVLGAFVAETRKAYAVAEVRAEAIQLATEALPLDNEALDRADRAQSSRRSRQRKKQRR